MRKFSIMCVCVAALCASYCTTEVVETSVGQGVNNGSETQGTQLEGIIMQGTTTASMTMQGFQFTGATLNGAALVNLRVQQGELVAEQDQVTLHGISLKDAHLYAQARNLAANPPTSAVIEYRIANVIPEDAAQDPTNTGSTFLYTLEQNVDNTNSWQPACPVDANGRRVAIPLTATWDQLGARVESSSLFTFGCTTGVIAKCYRWGYRPWVTGYGDLVAMHWACTRLARADYCGNGKPHTQDGKVIYVWDGLPPPGPVRDQGGHHPGFKFEAGWNTGGAACLGKTRWMTDMQEISETCPEKLMPPGQAKKDCDSVEDAQANGLDALLFNES